MIKAPFPWFGGKSRAADLIWSRLGNVSNYVEPFAGSLAVLLARRGVTGTETVNDADCYLSNFWRAVSSEPEAVAEWCDWPVSEADQNARHLWLVNRVEFRERMNTDPHFYDVKIAGWWVYGINCWIGDGWCELKGNAGRGVNRQLPHLGDAGQGVLDYFCALQDRLRRVRICCGDWARVLTPSVTEKHGVTGVLLDPPYDSSENQEYAAGTMCAQDVATWARENGDNPNLRIALCGYEGDYQMPGDWVCEQGKARKGYQKDVDAAKKERVWFSPHCLSAGTLFDEVIV